MFLYALPAKNTPSLKAQLMRLIWSRSKEILVLNQTTRDVLIVNAVQQQVVDVVADVFGGTLSEKIRPLVLATFSNGFLVGGSEGYVAIWERLDSRK